MCTVGEESVWSPLRPECGISASFQYLLVLHLVVVLAFSLLNHL